MIDVQWVVQNLISEKQLRFYRSRVGESVKRYLDKAVSGYRSEVYGPADRFLDGSEKYEFPRKGDDVLYVCFEYGLRCHHRVVSLRKVKGDELVVYCGENNGVGPDVVNWLVGLQLELRKSDLERLFVVLRGEGHDWNNDRRRFVFRSLGQGYDLYWYRMHAGRMLESVGAYEIRELEEADCLACQAKEGDWIVARRIEEDLGDGTVLVIR